MKELTEEEMIDRLIEEGWPAYQAEDEVRRMLKRKAAEEDGDDR